MAGGTNSPSPTGHQLSVETVVPARFRLQYLPGKYQIRRASRPSLRAWLGDRARTPAGTAAPPVPDAPLPRLQRREGSTHPHARRELFCHIPPSLVSASVCSLRSWFVRVCPVLG